MQQTHTYPGMAAADAEAARPCRGLPGKDDAQAVFRAHLGRMRLVARRVVQLVLAQALDGPEPLHA